MKHQPIEQILFQTLNHYVLCFQSPIDPINQCLPRHNLSHSQIHQTHSSSCIHFAVPIATDEKLCETQFFQFSKYIFRDNMILKLMENDGKYKALAPPKKDMTDI